MFFQGALQNKELLLDIGFPADRILCEGQRVAHTLGTVALCGAPHTPKLYQVLNFRMREHYASMGVKYLPLEERKEVLYFTRNSVDRSDRTSNGGREIRNERALLKKLQPVLDRRGLKLVHFRRSTFTSLKDAAAAVGRARLLWGMHGGAIYNLIFASPGTPLLDINPLEHIWNFYPTAVSIGMPYGYLRPSPMAQDPLPRALSKDFFIQNRRDYPHGWSVDPDEFVALFEKLLDSPFPKNLSTDGLGLQAS
jgi:hypothetical protein